MIHRIPLFGLAFVCCLTAAEPPAARISNGKIDAKLYLPDAANGYYRGTRFDWAGVIAGLETGGHSYFGVWFDKYDPKLHDAITGPVEEFFSANGALGFAEAAPGKTFIRIGVGVLRRPDDKPFQRFFTYDIVDNGKWKTVAKKDSVAFEHLLRDPATGYAYRYRKTVRLVPGKAELVIEHSLKNTGSKRITTDVYNHNFLVMDGQPTGPDFSVAFPFTPVSSRDLGDKAVIRGKEITYQHVFQPGETVVTELSGFGAASVADHEFRAVNRKTGAAVRISGDRPLSKIVYWSANRVLSPENYVTLDIAPGQETKWSVRYEFYSVK